MGSAGIPDIKSRFIQPPTERTGAYLPLLPGQTVCTVKNEKGENCTGHVKQWYTATKHELAKAPPGNTLHRSHRRFAVYEGPDQQHHNHLEKNKNK